MSFPTGAPSERSAAEAPSENAPPPELPPSVNAPRRDFLSCEGFPPAPLREYSPPGPHQSAPPPLLRQRKSPDVDRPGSFCTLTRGARQAAVAFSSLRMIEKMKSAESRHSTINTLHTIHSAMPLPQR